MEDYDISMWTWTPRWRWDYVTGLLQEGNTPSRKLDDNITIRAFRYCRRKLLAVSYRLMRRLRSDYPEIFEATGLDISTRGEKWFLEAALISGKSTEEVAELFGYNKVTVDAYEKLFFDVREHLDSPMWICSHLFGPALSMGVSVHEPDLLWKMLAYFGKWDVIENYLKVGELNNETELFLKNAVSSRMLKNAFNAAHVVVPNQYNALEILQQHLEVLRLEGEDTNSTASREVYDSIDLVLSAMNISVADKSDPAYEREPRASELLGENTFLELENTDGQLKLSGRKKDTVGVAGDN